MSETKEIIWNLINSLLAGGLVFLGALTTGSVTWESVSVSIIAAAVVAVSQFKDYWTTERPEYCSAKLFRFI